MSRYFLGCILALLCLNLPAQDLSSRRMSSKALDNAHILAKQGRYGQLVDILLPLLNSSGLDVEDRAQALVLLAAAYQVLGQFSESHRMLDQSLSLLRDHPRFLVKDADALANLSVLYRDTGDHDAMKQTALKALELYEHTNDHAGLLTVYVVLAQDSVNRRKSADAEHYLAQAAGEFTQLNKPEDVNRIALVDLQGAIALLEGHPVVAAEDYQQSLEMSIRVKGRLHPETGWGYMLLGKADLKAGDVTFALANMSQGLTILAATDGPESVAYLYSEVAYSEALAADGQRSQARQLKAGAKQALAALYRDQCARCQINFAALQ
jgi:tetratricopeptide (TPR) repeat protein